MLQTRLPVVVNISRVTGRTSTHWRGVSFCSHTSKPPDTLPERVDIIYAPSVQLRVGGEVQVIHMVDFLQVPVHGSRGWLGVFPEQLCCREYAIGALDAITVIHCDVSHNVRAVRFCKYGL
jgi:hypothetical protein